MDDMTEEELQEAFRMNQLLFKLNHTMPMTPEYENVLTLLCKNSLASLSREMNCPFKRGVVFLEFFLQNKKNILYYFPNALR